MQCGSVCSVKVIFGCFNSVLFMLGILKVVCGFLLLCDNHRVLLSFLLVAPESGLPHAPLYYVALALLLAGLVSCAASTLGCWATYMPGYAIFTMYFVVVLSLLASEIACGVLASIWERCAGLRGERGGPVAALQTYYGVSDYEHFTAAMDLAQTQLECCGMTEASNYDMSVWQLRRLGPRGVRAPLSCCVQTAPASHLNPVPLDHDQCQGSKPTGLYRHMQGCLGLLEEWYQEHYLIFMMTLFCSAIFKFGLLLCTVFSCVWVRKTRMEFDSILIKSTDNKTNENIYQTKMWSTSLTSRHDEPIRAKYIQPNNFYSPRVRNPRLFDSKPNEVV